MSVCIHSDVCRSWTYYIKEQVDTIFKNCPICPYFEPKKYKSRFPTKDDDYEMYYDYNRDQFIIKRKRNDNEN